MFADMHIHTTHSDGTFTPAEVIVHARAAGIGVMAICDHDVISGFRQAAPIAQAAGITLVPGVEINSLFLNDDTHILCFGADFENAELAQVIVDARYKMDKMSDDLLYRMQPDYPWMTMEDYTAFPHDERVGGWKMLEYLLANGVTKSLKEGIGLYTKYSVDYEEAGFFPTKYVVDVIHAAGGEAILAHPGVTFSGMDEDAQKNAVLQALDLGIDGIECYYHKHSADFTRWLVNLCGQRNLDITAGSDCHGSFSGGNIGCTQTPVSKIRLKVLENYKI